MREIKFREWMSGYGPPIMEYYDLFSPIFYEHEKKKDLKIMQYTGLKDKNGKEIYEGDVIKDGAGNIYKVHYSEKMACFVSAYSDGIICGSVDNTDEVIGNIYENPELVNKPKK